MNGVENRRPVASRNVSVWKKTAQLLVRLGFTPNQISVASSIFAMGGGLAMAQLGHSDGTAFYLCILGGFAGIQLRLLCNLFDGLMAVEGGLKTSAGDLYNDFPDRVSDLFLIVGASYAIVFPWGVELGWAAAFFACLTAYVRTLGASVGIGQDFSGPMAKQHRMATLNLALAAALIEKIAMTEVRWSFTVAIALIAIGSLVTCLRRLRNAACKLNLKAKPN